MPRNINFADEKASFGTPGQATAQFKTKDGQATFTLHKQNGKASRITATGKNGDPLKVFTLREVAAQEGDGSGSGSGSGGPVECWVCIKTPGGEFCYRIDCGDLPPQIPDPKNAL